MRGHLSDEDADVTVVPANQASWDDIEAVIGKAMCWDTRCFCQRYKLSTPDWRRCSDEDRAEMLRQQTHCGLPESTETRGLVAYLGGEAVGWCAVEPRTEFPRLTQIPWKERHEDKDDPDVWAITCLGTRVGYRKRGLMYVLVGAAVEYARAHGASALEGYPMMTHPGKEITWGELHVGARSAFSAAGFRQVTHPTKRRYVMRLDL